MNANYPSCERSLDSIIYMANAIRNLNPNDAVAIDARRRLNEVDHILLSIHEELKESE